MLDFESSMEHANFMHDLGIIAAELKNHFAIYRGDARKAEPYIGHFLWQYSRNEPEFHAITRALPFFISLGLLRMARMNGGVAVVLDDQKAHGDPIRLRVGRPAGGARPLNIRISGHRSHQFQSIRWQVSIQAAPGTPSPSMAGPYPPAA